nr:MAG TPA: hypothetical protein [Caudoviricetes sp.]
MKRWLQSIMEKEFEVQTPTRLGSNKKEKAIQLLNNGDMDSLFKCKKLITEIIKEKYDQRL